MLTLQNSYADMKSSPKNHDLIENQVLVRSYQSINEMRFGDLVNGAVVMGSFFAFSLVVWYFILTWIF